MTQEQINEQIAIIKKSGTEIRKSKESTRKFLEEAGIIKVQSTKESKSVGK